MLFKSFQFNKENKNFVQIHLWSKYHTDTRTIKDVQDRKTTDRYHFEISMQYHIK